MDNCIFCKIIKGELPSHKIYEDEDFIVILDAFPKSVGHSLLITKEHHETVFELSESTAQKLMPLAVRISKAMKKALKIDGLNHLQNNGKEAGQVVNHYHLHLIPRYVDDGLDLTWKTVKPTIEEFEDAATEIKKYL